MRMALRAHAVACVILIIPAQVGSAVAGELLSATRPIAEVVDRCIDAGLKKDSIHAAPPADDATLCRRITLDLVGRIPTVAEVQAYVASSDPEKRVHLIDRLMASPGFVRHQANEFDTMLMSGFKGSLRDYLIDALGKNRPWDQVFRELILPNEADKTQKIAAEFLRQRMKDLDRLTADVSSTFFGVNISCAQCHDHPLVKDWKQDHFYGMKSFLSRTFVNGTETKGFLGEHGYGSIQFKTTADVEKKARLMFLTGTRVDDAAAEPSRDDQKKEKAELDRSKKANVPPPPPKFSARAKLVQVALQDGDREFFARAIVNRIWHRLLGQGLVMPLDQMHSANPPSHPDLLAWLARDTATHGYDLRRLIRGLMLSAAYARDSRWDGGGESPRPSVFAVALVRPLSPMQMACSLRLATTDPAALPAATGSAEFEKKIESLETGARSLATAFATSSSGDVQIGVSEALFFSNGKRAATDLLAESDGRLVKRLKQTADSAELIKLAFLTTLSRPPDDDEMHTFSTYLGQRTDRPDDACQQLVWILLASSEFRFNH